MSRFIDMCGLALRFSLALTLLCIGAIKLADGWHDTYSTPQSIYYIAAVAELVMGSMFVFKRTAVMAAIGCCCVMMMFGIWAVSTKRVGTCGCLGTRWPLTPAAAVRLSAAIGAMSVAWLGLRFRGRGWSAVRVSGGTQVPREETLPARPATIPELDSKE